MYTNTQWLNFMFFVLIGLYTFFIPHTIFHNDFITIPLLVCRVSLFSTYLLAFVSVVFYYCHLSKVGLWLVSHSLMITEILFYVLIWLFICLEILRNIYIFWPFYNWIFFFFSWVYYIFWISFIYWRNCLLIQIEKEEIKLFLFAGIIILSIINSRESTRKLLE